MKETGVGLIGLGFMGRTHLGAYRAAALAGHANRIVAVCDARIERYLEGDYERGNLESDDAAAPLLDPKETRTTTDPSELLADPEVELVSICTPTDTHVALARQALEAGKHVLLEKPVALSSADASRIADAARAAERICMPAMCMRFWPGWEDLREIITSERYGRVSSAVFRRLGSTPGWSPEFYRNAERSGGALFDLHVHDADLVCWLFGRPTHVSTHGSLDHVTTAYGFADGPRHVVAEGGWNHAPAFPFFMGYTVAFERATLDFALGRTPLMRSAHEDEVREVELAPGDGYEGEIRHALALASGRETKPRATMDEAVELLRMLEAERSSLERGAPVALD